MKLLIIGHGRHGKDELAEFFVKNHGMKAESSSMAAARIFLYDVLKDKYGYKTFEECYEDRHNHRSEWFDLITEYNKDDKCRLAREIMKDSDIYVGMRSSEEIKACKEAKIFDKVLWIDRPGYPLEQEDSFNITINDADASVLNDGSLEDLGKKVDVYMLMYELTCKMSDEDGLPVKAPDEEWKEFDSNALLFGQYWKFLNN